jgi:hypothetical protein
MSVGESKILKHSERACPIGCISARSRLGPPTLTRMGIASSKLGGLCVLHEIQSPAVLVNAQTDAHVMQTKIEGWL